MAGEVRYLRKASGGRWKYQRDVPAPFRERLARARWEYSLGSDYTNAVARCSDLRRAHDREIADLAKMLNGSSIGGRTAVSINEAMRANALLVAEDAPTGVKVSSKDATGPGLNEMWRRTEHVMEKAKRLPPVAEWERLALHAAMAFGDGSHMERRQAAGGMQGTYMEANAVRPADGVGRAMWEAMKKMLDERLSILSPHADPNDPDRLTAVFERYAKFRNIADATRTTYLKGIKFFVADNGDLRVQDITKKMLRDQRDRWSEKVSPASVKQYMQPIKGVLAFAEEEETIEISPAVRLSMPPEKETIEERKWHPFSCEEVRAIFAEADRRWADDAPKSKLSLERRTLYRLTLRTLMVTGARPHELWRLQPDWAGDHDREGWQGRGIDIRSTKAGKRLIPCPSQALPFADFVVAGGLKCLSPDSDRMATHKEIASRVKGFNDLQLTPLLMTLGIKRPKISFRSTRPTFWDAMERQGASDSVVQDVVGHVRKDKMMRHYKSRSEMEAMLAAMEAVEF